MKVLLIYRNDSAGFSIRRVFEPIERHLAEHCEIEVFKMPYYKVCDIYKNIKALNTYLNNRNYDIIHISGDVYYLSYLLKRVRHKSGTKYIVTVHDLGVFTQHKKTIFSWFYYLLWIYPLRFADRLTFISQPSLEECDKLIHCGYKSEVVYNPFDERYVPTDSQSNQLNKVLHIGTGPNKNLENVIKAMSGFNFKICIVGRLNEAQIKLLKSCHIDYSNRYDISDEQILAEYNNCDIVSFPSLYEGFGMPIIEGQAVGKVVVTSDRSPMREIADGSALLVDPLDTNSIREGFLKAQRNYATYQQLGQSNIKRFHPKEIARHYYSIYLDLIRQKKL